MTRHPGSERGFSLLELVMVLVMIGLVAAVSYPLLSRGTTSIELHAGGRDFLNVLRYAREKAVTGQSELRILVNAETRKVVLADAFGEGMRFFDLPRSVGIGSLSLGGEPVREGPLVIRFLPNGSCESAEIVLRSESGATLTLVTDAITGGARIITEREGGR